MAAVKIKISALAKDLGVDKNEMLELLQTFGSKAKSAQSSIESNELDIVFEHYTQKYQVEDFGFDKKASESKKEKKSAKKVEETVETVEELFEKKIDGFGEIFRHESYLEIGSGALLSRATAGVYKNCCIF